MLLRDKVAPFIVVGLPEHFNKIFLFATILWAILELKQNKDTIIQ